MSQILYARNLTLGELEERFHLKLSAQSLFHGSKQELPSLQASEIQALERIRQHYDHLSRQRKTAEEAVKLVIVSPLLDLAGFYDPPFSLETEKAIELGIEDQDTIVRGAIDILVLQQQFWVLVVESKQLGFDVMVALPQALAYMLDAPDEQSQVFGLLTNGREFVFVQLNKQTLQYSLSPSFSLYPQNQLDRVLHCLKQLEQVIRNKA